jgi:hypothetical protein
LIRRLTSTDYLNNFFLVGGTALALYLGHRKSIDIDLFSELGFDVEGILRRLEKDFGFAMSHSEPDTLLGSIGGIKVDLITHAYLVISRPVKIEGIRIADIRDIIAMKVNAIANSGERVKDFIDMYFLVKEYSIDEIVECYEKKYQQRNSLHAVKSLIYFEDAIVSEWPVLIREPGLTWQSVRKRLEDDCIAYFINMPDQNRTGRIL